MQFSVTTDSPRHPGNRMRDSALVRERTDWRPPRRPWTKSCGGVLGRLVESGDASAKPGRTRLLPGLEGIAAERVLLTGCGKEDAFNAKGAERGRCRRRAGPGRNRRHGCHQLPGSRRRRGRGCLSMPRASPWPRPAAPSIDSTNSRAKHRKTANLTRFAIAAGTAGDASEAERGATHGQAIASGVSLARDLGNRPPNVCTPSHLADEARALAERFGRLETEVLDEDEMQRLGMGALLSVTQRRRGTGPPDRDALQGRRRHYRACGNLRQGNHLRYGRHLHQALRQDGRDEVRHVRCGQRARRHGRDSANCNLRSMSSAWSRHARTCPAGARHARATSSPACRERPSKCSIPTPRDA